MKKFLILLILAVLIGGSAMAYDFYAVCESGQTLFYNITSNVEPCTVEVTYPNNYNSPYSGYTKPVGNLSIPSSVTNNGITYSVTSIGENAFFECSELTSITIPSSVTSIGGNPFIDSGLTSIIVEQGNTVYDSRDNCNAIIETQTNKLIVGCMNTTIPNSVTSIGAAFDRCNGLTSVTIPNSVTSIGDCAFQGCEGLTSVTIPNSVTSIGSAAFNGCWSLTSVTIPNSVTFIGDAAFSYCSRLTEIAIPESVMHIYGTSLQSTGWYNNQPNGVLYLDSWCLGHKGNVEGHLAIEQGTRRIAIGAFAGCTGITSVSIPNSVKYLSGFNRCSGLTSVDIPNSVETIGENAFGYSGLTSITIPNSVTTMELRSFEYCTALSCLNYNASNCILMNIYDGYYDLCPFIGCTALTTINIGDNVQTIPDGAFVDCDGLTTINFNATNCTNLGGWPYNNTITTVNIGSNVTNIPNGAFARLQGLTSVTIPESVTRIGSYAFSGCSSLTSVTIPNPVATIGRNAFSGCTNLSTLNFNATNCTILFDDNEYYYYYDGQYVFGDCPNLATINIGDNVRTIPEYAFPECTGLTSVAIPNSVTSIGNYAFSGCSGLTEVTIGNSVTSIGDGVFINCSGLSSVTIGNSVTSIGRDAFGGCSGLTSISIPNSVTSIGVQAFEYCSRLTSITIPNSVTSIASGTFQYCTSLASVTIPNSVMSIGGYAFYRCTNLSSVIIPNSVISIDGRAFYKTGLTSVTIPQSTRLGESVFLSCQNLMEINVQAGNTYYKSIDGVLFNYQADTLITYPAGKRGSYTTPNTTTTIGFEAFYECTNLSSVFIGNSVRTISPAAFSGCTNLTEIYLGNSVETICGGAFWCNESFKSSAGTIFVLGDVPPTLSHGEDFEGLGVFPEEDDPYYENSFRRLIVCCGNRDTYEASDWANYFNNIEEDCNRYSISSNSSTVQGGSFNISSSEARLGEDVLVYVTIDAGYVIDHITAFNADNPDEIVPITRTGSRSVITYSMTMPAFAVRIEVGFREGSGIENNELVELSIFPNPTTDILNIKSSETISEIEIVNTLGQVVKRIEINADNAVCNVEDLTSGVYVVRIYGNPRISTGSVSGIMRKFIKE